MKIYFIHASTYPDYKLLYNLIRASKLNKDHNFFFPHELTDQPKHSKEIISESDLIIAEVSYPSTGLGIEIGWADFLNRKILCIYKSDAKVSSSLQLITPYFFEYRFSEDLIFKLDSWIEENQEIFLRRPISFTM